MASAAESAEAADTSRPVNPRTSRWSDGPPARGSSDSTPSVAATEPPLKKPRSDSQVHGSSDADGPPGLPDGSSAALATAATVTSASALTSSNPTYNTIPSQNYTYAGNQTFGPGYGGYGTGGPVSFAPGSAKGNGALFYKTKLCNNFKTGACTFGERCHFAHGVEELRKPPTAWEGTAGGVGGRSTPIGMGGQPRKVRMCRYYLEGNCPYGDRCNFLHGNEQVPGSDASTGVRGPGTTWPSYKSRLCAKWERGEACDYGDKCHYAHGHEELQRYSGAAYPNGGTGIPDMQQTSYNSVMNPPPLAAPYTAAVNYQQPGVPTGGPPANVASYPVAGVGVQPYTSSQEGMNGTSSAYSYWGATATPNQPVIPSQGYSQILPWVAAYAGDYSSGREGVEQQQQQQQQPQPQPQPHLQSQPQLQLQQQPTSAYVDTAAQYSQQQQSASYVTAGNVNSYQVAAVNANPPYSQSESRSGDVGYYQAASNYPIQQADYGSGYPVA